MIGCTDIFWHEFYKGAGVALGLLLPMILGFGAVLLTLFLTIFRLQHRHEEAMQEARMRPMSPPMICRSRCAKSAPLEIA